ncbi:MAG: Cell division trigger factor [uncultured Propionibacteriaceae bacterium]|uniref:Trigger factor n=1 Tax=uncultured Propionibacteriaceae bacterium TaxID=257457 RepID=A0A6J4P8J7_9ACTN|nr:MAG: Cell division trigger factor [uncultured Propionibacteriaceae bacterium]
MPSTVEQLSPTRVKITVEVPFADLKPSMDKAYREIAKTVNIPGFRAGKVPPMVIDQRFGRGAIIQEALNEAIPQFYGRAVQENDLSPLASPDVEVTKLEDGDRIEFTAEVDVRPDFDLPAFDSLNVSVDALEVPSALVDEQIDTLRNRFGSRTPVERPAADGDIATINLAARKDGEDLEDAKAEGMEYTVGSGQMLDGLDEAVTGLSSGESATFNSTLVGGPMRGEEVEVTVTVTKVAEEELPEVDDEFAQLASEFDTVEEMRADLGTRLTQMARLEQASKARDAVLESLIAQLDIAVPEAVLAGELEARREQIQSQLAQAGLTLEQYLSDTEDDQDEEGFWADVEKRSADALKAQIILDKVADEHQIDVDQNDLTQHIIRKAQQEGTSPNQIAEHMQEHPHHIQEYMIEIRRGKALALIVESATVTDSKGAPVDLAGLLPDGTLASEASAEDAELTEDSVAGDSAAVSAGDESASDESVSGDSASNESAVVEAGSTAQPAAEEAKA